MWIVTGAPSGPGDRGRRVEPEKFRAPLHDADRGEHGPRITGLDAGRETDSQHIKSATLEVAQALGLLAVQRS
jgi:hypothetical protein